MSKPEEPVYLHLIKCIQKGFSILDSPIQHEIIDFIKSQQKEDGSFVDRSGESDLYYSLFGHWLCFAIDLKEQELLLQHYIKSTTETRTNKLIDKLALLLISVDLNPVEAKYSLYSILKMHYKNSKTVDFAYHFFILTLVIDALGKNKRLFNIIIRIVLLFYSPGENVPCSILASIVFAKHKAGLKKSKEQSKLISFNNTHGGFRAFRAIKNSDMLSTGVALFALKKIGYELRTIKPGCLNFVQQNYNSGAFLSGDGDKTKDLEYTFYGLLALGSLVDYEK